MKIRYPNINIENVKALNPCEGRFMNFTAQYPNFSGTLTDFLYLENISYKDKVWVFVRLATQEQNVKWSILCAESVINHYKSKYQNDNRPQEALKAAETFLKNPNEKNRAAANAANAAAYAAANAAANAANAAAYAAANAANAAANAAYAVAYAANAANAAYAAYAAAYAAANAANAAAYAAANAANAAAYAEKIQEELNLQFMIEACRD